MKRSALLLAFSACTLGIGAAWSLVAAAPASAHATLQSSSPADGELLDEPPDQMRFAFSEPPDLGLTTISVVDGSGADVATAPPERGGSNRQIRVPLDRLPDGVYTVTWRTVSSTDGHVTAGAFSFGVGVAPGTVTPAAQTETGAGTPPPSAVAVAGLWMLYAGLVALFGAGITGLLAFGTTAVRPWLLEAAWGCAAVGVVLMTLGERAAIDVPLGTLLSSEAGGKLILLALTVAIAGIAVLAAALAPGRRTLVAVTVTAAGAMLARVVGGHAGDSPLAVLTQWLHLLGVGMWIGGLVWLIVGLLRSLDPARVRRFSTLAGIGLAVVVASGVLRSVEELGMGWWMHPFDADYSTTLVVKLSIVLILVALGALNRYRNIGRLEAHGSRPLARTVGGELVLAAGVFAATAVLTSLAPRPNVAQATPRAPEPLVVRGSDFATTTKVELRISPGTVGPNAFVAEIRDYDTGEPVDADRVSLTFELPGQPEVRSALELKHGDDTTWLGKGTALAQPGAWTVTVLVEGASSSAEVPLEVTPKTQGQRVEVSRVPGQPDLYTITLAGGVQIQAYVDPGRPGRTNQVHVTVFDADGAELPLRDAVLTIHPSDAQAFEPDMLRFGPGHFVANVDLTAGTWTFDVRAHARDGQDLTASFEQTFGG